MHGCRSHACHVQGRHSFRGVQMDTSRMNSFHAALSKARHVCVLTGAGVSAESGIPTFRGAGGLWRTYEATELGRLRTIFWREQATPGAFKRDPSLVWEFYHWRREVISGCKPNPAHYALAAFQQKLEAEGRKMTLLTQNIDGLHAAAKSTQVTELHGSLWRVCRASRDGTKDPSKLPWEDHRQPLAAALEGRGAPDHKTLAADIPVSELPHDEEGYLLRPGVVWFGETLDAETLNKAEEAIESCNLFLTVGTSSAVHPAAGFAAQVKSREVPLAEFNLDASGATAICDFVFQGKAGETLPRALGVEEEVRKQMRSQ